MPRERERERERRGGERYLDCQKAFKKTQINYSEQLSKPAETLDVEK